jgi:alkylhydroperoxidase family enzyme
MRLDMPRLLPLPEDQWSDEVREILGGVNVGARGRPANIFTTLARHPKLLRRWLVFGNHVLFKSTLPARERELAILRVGWLSRSAYEFGQHTVIGRQAGLTDEEIRRVTLGPDAAGWSADDAVLLRAVDELHEDSFVCEATWNALARRFTTEQVLDLLFAVGQYRLVSGVLNTLGVQLDEGVPGWPGGNPPSAAP